MRILKGGVAIGSIVLSQNSTGFAGGTEVGDAFGAFVRFLDNTGSGNETLAVGAPGEDASAGALFVLPSTGIAAARASARVRLDESVDPRSPAARSPATPGAGSATHTDLDEPRAAA